MFSHKKLEVQNKEEENRNREFVCLFVCLHVCLFICLFACLFVCFDLKSRYLFERIILPKVLDSFLFSN